MTEYKNSFEGGTATATIAGNNSGGASGDAFGFVSAPTTGVSPVYDNSRSAHGSMSAKLPVESGKTCYMQLGAIGSGWAATQFATRFYVQLTALPPGPYTLFRGNDDNAAIGLRVNVDNAGRFVLSYGNGSTVTAYTATTAAPLNQWLRVEARIERSATAGVVSLGYYAWDSLTPLEPVYTSASNLNTGTTPITSAAFGKFGTDTSTAAIWLDDLRVNTATTSFIGPASNVVPTLTLTGNQNVAAGATVSVAASAADADGSIASYAWSTLYASAGAPTLTGASTANLSFIAPAAGNLVILQCVVTDDQGATATATTEVRVPLAGSAIARPLPMDGVGAAWTSVGGSATEGAALADESDATYVQSPNLTSTATVRRYRLQPTSPRSTAKFTLRQSTDTSGATCSTVIKLYEGNTLRKTFSATTITDTWTDTDYTYTDVLPNISDPGALWFEPSATA